MHKPRQAEKSHPEFVPFNRPTVLGTEQEYLKQVLTDRKFSGDGPFSLRCMELLKTLTGSCAVLTTPSCTHALEMAAILCDLDVGDEVILPSFAYPTTAAAFSRCGAKLVFVDVNPQTMNIDSSAVAAAITDRTRAIVALHYAGVACDMVALAELAASHNLILVEDAAQAIDSYFNDRPCGSFGSFGCLSFHETKNIHCGEGGALLINDPQFVSRAEIVREKGTDRSRFFRGEVDTYTWQDMGSSYVLSELNAAFLCAQLEAVREVTANRLEIWNTYLHELQALSQGGYATLPSPPDACSHNGHIFWLKTHDAEQQTDIIGALRKEHIHAVFHYQALHVSPAGRRFGRFSGADEHSSSGSQRLIRLPLFYGFEGARRVARKLRRCFGLA